MIARFLRRLLHGRPKRVEIPDELWSWALEQHPICSRLSDERVAQLRTRTGELRARLYIDAVPGVPNAEELRLSVALQAALPVLELGVEWYRAVRTILLVPGEYEREQEAIDEAGVVHEGRDIVSGEFGQQAPVVLSVDDIEASGWGDGYNVVIHEMAHVLDGTNGELDGMPALPPRLSPASWREAMTDAYNDHLRRSRRAERAEAGGRTPTQPPIVDPYGAEGREEFFACALELIFERPAALRRGYPRLYEQLCAFLGFDPAGTDV